MIRRPRSRPSRTRVVSLAAAVAGWLVLFGPSLAEHVSRSARGVIFNGDARQQIWPLYRFRDPGLFPNDVAVDYYLRAFLPFGYRSLYAALASLADPRTVSKVLPYLLLLVTVVAIAASARMLGVEIEPVTGAAPSRKGRRGQSGDGAAPLREAERLGGTLVFFASGALCLSSGAILPRLAGGLPRSFALPILALALWSLVAGRVLPLAATAVLAAAFYPPVAAVPGLSLAILLLGTPAAHRGRARDWTLRKRLAALAITAALAILAVAPTAIGAGRYGRTIGAADAAAFPETGPEGRYERADRPFSSSLFRDVRKSAGTTFLGSGEPFLPAARSWLEGDPGRERVVVVLLLGLVAAGVAALALRPRGAAGRRVVVFIAGGLAAYGLQRLLEPRLFLPQRVLTYAVPVVCLTVLVPGVAALADLVGRKWWRGPARDASVDDARESDGAARVGVVRPPLERGGAPGPASAAPKRDRRPRTMGAAAGLGVAAAVLLVCGGRIDPRAGLTVDASSSRRLYAFLAFLPENALVAGFPGGVVENVPYLCRRSAYLTYETHQVFRTEYALEMRRRMRAFTAAYFAPVNGAIGVAPSSPEATRSEDPLLRLRNQDRVTHLIVDMRHFGPDAPAYFAPFTDEIRAAHEAGLRAGFEVMRITEQTQIFQDGDVVVLDLARLGRPR